MPTGQTAASASRVRPPQVGGCPAGRPRPAPRPREESDGPEGSGGWRGAGAGPAGRALTALGAAPRQRQRQAQGQAERRPGQHRGTERGASDSAGPSLARPGRTSRRRTGWTRPRPRRPRPRRALRRVRDAPTPGGARTRARGAHSRACLRADPGSPLRPWDRGVRPARSQPGADGAPPRWAIPGPLPRSSQCPRGPGGCERVGVTPGTTYL